PKRVSRLAAFCPRVREQVPDPGFEAMTFGMPAAQVLVDQVRSDDAGEAEDASYGAVHGRNQALQLSTGQLPRRSADPRLHGVEAAFEIGHAFQDADDGRAVDVLA